MKKGFTLIELLIVVAIIAILAAIAVPNFLEARARAKVSRAKADMRSLATAIEAYVVDNNTTPLIPTEPIHGNSGYCAPLSYTPSPGTTPSNPPGHRLTTPIAYITMEPIMAFQPGIRSEGLSRNNSDYSYIFVDFMGAKKDMDIDIGPWENNSNGDTGWGDEKNGKLQVVQIPTLVKFRGMETTYFTNWLLFSLGPSLILDIQPGGPGEAAMGGSTSNPMWVFGDYNHYSGLGTGSYLPYDPTNGTQSLGCVFRLSGSGPD